MNLEDEHQSGRLSKLDNDVLATTIKERPDITTRELAEELDISKSTVHEHLVSLGYTSRYNVWVPHKLSEKNCFDRYSICDMLLKWNESMPFLKTLVNGDEKWIVYDNVVRKRSWCLRNESPSIIYYEILPQNQTINSDVYCRQLSNLAEKLERLRLEVVNRKRAVFQQDNARPHESLATRTKLHELCWDLLPHPPYSPGITPSDYHLFFLYRTYCKEKASLT